MVSMSFLLLFFLSENARHKTAATAPATLIFLAAAPVASFTFYLSSSGPFKGSVIGIEA